LTFFSIFYSFHPIKLDIPKGGEINSSPVRSQASIHSNSPAAKSISSQGSPSMAAIHPLSTHHQPLQDITEEPSSEDCKVDDVSSLYQLPPHLKPIPGHAAHTRYYASSAVVADMKTVIPLKELVDLIRKKLNLESSLVMAAIIAQGNALLGFTSTGMMKEDAFRIAAALKIIDQEDS
jgi:hypothetical protein